MGGCGGGVLAFARPWAEVRPRYSRPAVPFCVRGGTRARPLRVVRSPGRTTAPPLGDLGEDPGWGPAALCHRSHVRAELYYWASGFFFFYCRIDPYGFERPEDFDYAAYEEFFSTYLVILTRRAIKWSKLLKGSSSVQKSMTGEFGAWSITHAANRSLAVKCSWEQRSSGFLRPLTLGGCLESGVCIFPAAPETRRLQGR